MSACKTIKALGWKEYEHNAEGFEFYEQADHDRREKPCADCSCVRELLGHARCANCEHKMRQSGSKQHAVNAVHRDRSRPQAWPCQDCNGFAMMGSIRCFRCKLAHESKQSNSAPKQWVDETAEFFRATELARMANEDRKLNEAILQGRYDPNDPVNVQHQEREREATDRKRRELELEHLRNSPPVNVDCEKCKIGDWLTRPNAQGVRFVCTSCDRARQAAEQEAKRRLEEEADAEFAKVNVGGSTYWPKYADLRRNIAADAIQEMDGAIAKAILGSQATAYFQGVDIAKGRDSSSTVVFEKTVKPFVPYWPEDAKPTAPAKPESPVPYTNDAEARARAEFAWQALQAWGDEPGRALGHYVRKDFRRYILAIWDTSDAGTTAWDRLLPLVHSGTDEVIAKQVLRAYQGWTP